jgi:hypothetical protein
LPDHPLEAIGRPDADPLARLYPQGQQAAGAAGGGIVELAVGEAHPLGAHHQRLLIAMALDGVAQIGADGLAQERRVAGPVGIGEERSCAVHAFLAG